MKETLIYDIDKLTNIKIKLLNVQCPTQAKIIEIEDNIDKETIYFLTETHARDNSVKMKDGIRFIHKTREINDK